MQASSLCVSSGYAATLSAVTFLIPGTFAISLFAAPVAWACGGAGLLWLAKLTRSPQQKHSLTPHERVAIKTIQRARKRGALGLVGGLVLSSIHLVMLLG